MRLMTPLSFLLFTALAAGPSTQPVSDEARIQGRWHLVEQLDTKGRSHPLTKDAPDYSFEGEKLFSFSEGEKRELGRFSLNPKATPKEIDLIFVNEKTGRVDEAATMRGIYAIDGDTLKFTIAPTGARPTGFDATQRTAILNTLKRVKKAE